eukprot:78031-Pelagomonas_calceolata.AAC.2
MSCGKHFHPLPPLLVTTGFTQTDPGEIMQAQRAEKQLNKLKATISSPVHPTAVIVGRCVGTLAGWKGKAKPCMLVAPSAHFSPAPEHAPQHGGFLSIPLPAELWQEFRAFCCGLPVYY